MEFVISSLASSTKIFPYSLITFGILPVSIIVLLKAYSKTILYFFIGVNLLLTGV